MPLPVTWAMFTWGGNTAKLSHTKDSKKLGLRSVDNRNCCGGVIKDMKSCSTALTGIDWVKHDNLRSATGASVSNSKPFSTGQLLGCINTANLEDVLISSMQL